MDWTPRHWTPPSSVTKTRTSVPAVVRVGDVPPGHLKVVGHVTVYAPPFVNSSMKPAATVLTGAPATTKEVLPDTSAEKKLAEARSRVVVAETLARDVRARV